MCGRGLSERLLLATFASPSVGLPCLTTLALKGAYRLSDIGLSTLVRSAPLLRSLDLSRCSFLSEAGIHTLADSLAPLLKELHLEECHQLEALKILPALKKMQNLEILSVAGIPSVTDAFTSELLAHLGYNLRELSLADCGKTTDYSLETIGVVCCGLNSLTLDGPAVLHELGRFPVHSLEIPSFLSTKTPEEALVHVVGEARRTTPSILYLPQLQLWWETAHDQLRVAI